jgi:hypothetical protein
MDDHTVFRLCFWALIVCLGVASVVLGLPHVG